MQPQFTLHELLDFCLANRRGPLFEAWPPYKIAYVLAEASARKILHVTAADNKITGMVIARPVSADILRIEHILCVTPKSLASLLDKCAKWYPGRKLAYNRRGKERVINQERMRK